MEIKILTPLQVRIQNIMVNDIETWMLKDKLYGYSNDTHYCIVKFLIRHHDKNK